MIIPPMKESDKDIYTMIKISLPSSSTMENFTWFINHSDILAMTFPINGVKGFVEAIYTDGDEYYGAVSITPKEWKEGFEHSPEECVLYPRFAETNTKMYGIGYILNIFELRIKNKDVIISNDKEETCKGKISPIKITKRDLITKSETKKVIKYFGSDGLHKILYGSGQSLNEPPIMLALYDGDNLIAEGLTNWRCTNHNTLEFTNHSRKSIVNIRVDLKPEEFEGKYIGHYNHMTHEYVNKIPLGQYVLHMPIYKFSFKNNPDHYISKMFESAKSLFGVFRHSKYDKIEEEYGMLGISGASLCFVPEDLNKTKVRYSVDDIVSMNTFEFTVFDYRMCELVPTEMSHLEEERANND